MAKAKTNATMTIRMGSRIRIAVGLLGRIIRGDEPYHRKGCNRRVGSRYGTGFQKTAGLQRPAKPETGAADDSSFLRASRWPGARSFIHFSYFKANFSRFSKACGFLYISRNAGTKWRTLSHTR